jgi:spermidine/putrescine transport system substrate-binding protein
MKLFALAAVMLVASVGLAACGGDGGLGGSDNEDVPTASDGKASGNLTISNWPLYIDPGENGTVAEFQEKTGIKTKYIEDVNDANSFFGKMQPLLSSGDSGDRSLIVLPDWMVKKMYDLGYVQKLDHAALGTVFDNMQDNLLHPAFDPEREFSVPWQSGMTGLVVRKDLAPDVKSVNDLFDPKYKGKVTMLSEMRDTLSVVMLADGVDTDNATVDDWNAAIDKLKKYSDNGQIRRFTGNDYIQDMAKGDVVAAIGWSGDAVQAQLDNPNIVYRQPTEGCEIWSDNMFIPVGAPNTPAAYKFMNFVYQPEVQADIAKYVNYLSPVKGVKEIIQKTDPDIANNQLIFPSSESLKNCVDQPQVPGSPEEQKQIEQNFQDLLTG